MHRRAPPLSCSITSLRPSLDAKMHRSCASAVSAARRFSTAVVKRSTGIVGLDVVPEGRAVLAALYERILRDVRVIPAHVSFRDALENATRYRLGVVNAVEDVSARPLTTRVSAAPHPRQPALLFSADRQIAAIETEINAGQVEQLIEQAKSDLELIPQFASWRTWEATPTVTAKPSVLEELESLSPGAIVDRGLLPEQVRAAAAKK
jgi:hypothetical protein